MYRVNKEKCIGCGLCTVECEGATELKEDGKAEVIDQKKLEECGGEKVCPYGAIEKIEEK
jgi:ferredoxin